MTTTPTRPQLEALIAGTEGVTPGPWFTTGSPWFHGNDGVLCGSPDGNIAYLIADCDDGLDPRDEYTGPFPLGDKDADAAHIARCSPEFIRSIASALLSSQDEVARLREALEGVIPLLVMSGNVAYNMKQMANAPQIAHEFTRISEWVDEAKARARSALTNQDKTDE